MEISSATWWSEMETTDMNNHSFINSNSQMMMTPFNELSFNKPQGTHHMTTFCHSNSPSADTSAVAKNAHFEKLNTLIKTEVPSGTTINFSSSNSLDSDFGDGQNLIQSFGFGTGDTNTQKKSYSRTGLQAQDHVLAERKRRERLTQRFIAISTLLPNLKKLDKASVLGDAIKYIKQLEERVKTLEEKAKKCNEEPVVSVKRARLISSYEDSLSSDENSSISTDTSFPDIEVRASDGNIMITIYCKKQTGILNEIFNEVEKLHLSINSSSVMPFGYATTHITIIAQMDHQFSMTPNHVANRIRAAMMKLINNLEEDSFVTA